MKTKTYPKSLHLYRLLYTNDTVRSVYACGMTHAYAMSREYWPSDKIKEILQLDDSWKN